MARGIDEVLSIRRPTLTGDMYVVVAINFLG
jgi:hypothetical protein